MDEIKVQLKSGEVILIKPLAKAFTKAMEEAEISNGELKMTKLFNYLLPHCIKTHPWGMKKISDALGDLQIEEYVKLFNELKNLIKLADDVPEK